MESYYGRRAAEYEQIYRRPDPVQQPEQAALAQAMQTALAGRCVLEVACGAGYSTAHIAPVARRIVAVDAAAETLTIAQAKGLPDDKVTFSRGDAYTLDAVAGAFNAGLATFWFSHVPRARLDEFLIGFHRRLEASAVVFLADNVNRPGVGGELIVRPGEADTYKRRQLTDGTTHEVLKNYYSAEQLRGILGPHASALELTMGRCYWWAQYVVADGRTGRD